VNGAFSEYRFSSAPVLTACIQSCGIERAHFRNQRFFRARHLWRWSTQKTRVCQERLNAFLWSHCGIGQSIYIFMLSFVLFPSLWSPYGIGQTIIFSSCFFFFLLLSSSSSSFFSSPNLSSRRLDVYHTSAHGVVLV